MPHDLAKHNITLIAERVLPQIKACDVGCDIGGGMPLIADKFTPRTAEGAAWLGRLVSMAPASRR
jgi:hypothetical protein